MMLRMWRGLTFTLFVRFFNKYYVATIPKSRINWFFCSCIVMAQYQRAFVIVGYGDLCTTIKAHLCLASPADCTGGLRESWAGCEGQRGGEVSGRQREGWTWQTFFRQLLISEQSYECVAWTTPALQWTMKGCPWSSFPIPESGSGGRKGVGESINLFPWCVTYSIMSLDFIQVSIASCTIPVYSPRNPNATQNLSWPV